MSINSISEKICFLKVKICGTGGAIRDLVFENLVIGGEQIEEMDHFYTNQYVHDLQFSWLKYSWKYRLAALMKCSVMSMRIKDVNLNYFCDAPVCWEHLQPDVFVFREWIAVDILGCEFRQVQQQAVSVVKGTISKSIGIQSDNFPTFQSTSWITVLDFRFREALI